MLHGKGCKKDVKIIVWSGLLFLCLAARALATGVVGYLPMSDGEYAQKRVDPALFCIARPDLALSPGRSQWRDATAGAEKR